MTTSAATVNTDYAAAITALALVVSDVQDASTGALATETLAGALSAYERDVLAKAAANAAAALKIMQDGTGDQLAGTAF